MGIGRKIAFLSGAAVGSQVVYLPQHYILNKTIEKDLLKREADHFYTKLNPGLYNKVFGKKDDYDKKTLQGLYKEKVNEYTDVSKVIQQCGNANLTKQLTCMVVDPRGSYDTLKHYKPGLDPKMWKETGISAVIGGILAVAVYEVLKRKLKKKGKKNGNKR